MANRSISVDSKHCILRRPFQLKMSTGLYSENAVDNLKHSIDNEPSRAKVGKVGKERGGQRKKVMPQN